MAEAKITIRGEDLASEVFAKIAKALEETKHKTEDAHETSESFWSSLAGKVAVGELVAHGIEKLGEIAFEAVEKIAEAVPEAIEKTMKLGDELLVQSLKTGISVESLSKLRYVAAQTGTELETITGVIFKMQMNLGGVGPESAKTKEGLDRLKLTFDELRNSKPDEAFLLILERLHEIPNASERAAVGASVFGRGWKQISQLAIEDVDELMHHAEELGIVMSTDTAAAAKAAEDSISSLKFQVEAITLRIGGAFLPAVIGITHDLSVGLKAAVDESSNSLGHQEGILGLVTDAMGTGDKAIEAQTQLYYKLREVVITLVQGGLEPLISTAGFIMTEWNALRVVTESAVEGWQGITYVIEGVIKVFLELQKYTNPAGWAGAFDGMIASVDKDMNRLYNSMAQSEVKIASLKGNEEYWKDWAANTNKSIEAGIAKVREGHIDIAAIIHETAELSRNASQQAQSDDSESSKEIAKSHEELRKIVERAAQESAKVRAEATQSDLDIQLKTLEIEQHNAEEDAKSKKLTAQDLSLALLAIQAQYEAKRDQATQKAAETEESAERKLQAQIENLRNESASRGYEKAVQTMNAQEAAEVSALDKRKLGQENYDKQVNLIHEKYLEERKNLDVKTEQDMAAAVKAVRDETNSIYIGMQADTVKKEHDLNDQRREDAIAQVRLQAKGTEDEIEDLVTAINEKYDALEVQNRQRRFGPTSENLREMAADARETFREMQASGEYSAKSVREAWKKAYDAMHEDELDQLHQHQQDLDTLASGFQQLAQISQGSFGNIAKDIGTVVSSMSMASKSTETYQEGVAMMKDDVGGGLAKTAAGIMGMVGAMDQATNSGSTLHKTLGGAMAGAEMGAQFGGAWGAAVGAAIGGLTGLVRGIFGGPDKDELAAREEYKKFSDQMVDLFNKTATAQERVEAGGTRWKEVNIAVRDAYVAVGKSGEEAMAALGVLNNATHHSAAEVQAAEKAINDTIKERQDLMDAEKQKQDLLNAAVDRYHFTEEELGPSLQKQKLSEQVEQLIEDYGLLTDAGVDTNAITLRMGESINDFVHKAIKMGTEVPEAMRPMLEAMVKAGTLTDENGNKIDDLSASGITFGETLTENFKHVVDKIQELIDTIKGAVTGIDTLGSHAVNAAANVRKIGDEVNSIPRDIDLNVTRHYDDYSDPGSYASHGGLVTSSGVRPLYLDAGGPVGGPRGTDTVPAWLTPGEGVVSTRGMEALGKLNSGHSPIELSTQGLESKLDRMHSQTERLFTELPYMLRHATRGTA